MDIYSVLKKDNRMRGSLIDLTSAAICYIGNDEYLIVFEDGYSDGEYSGFILKMGQVINTVEFNDTEAVISFVRENLEESGMLLKTGKYTISKSKETLYIIKDKHGNQLSSPNSDMNELWDRVSNMEARGNRGLSVVVYRGE